jgi:UDP-N-acetylmuramoylalanine--D-glutamate ligase
VSGVELGLLDKKRFLVFGLGKSGKAVARLLVEKSGQVVVSDDDEAVVDSAPDTPELSGWKEAIEFVGPDAATSSLSTVDVVVVSPGVPLDNPLVEEARRLGIVVTGEIEVAYLYCSSPIIAVTGTNGKSTVVNMLGAMFKSANREAVVAGNIGTPFSEIVREPERRDAVIIEISSFQLDTISEFKPNVAVLLNVTPDHLDRYGNSFDEYARSKARILNRADDETVFVYNAEDRVCRTIAGGFSGRTIPFSSESILEDGVFVTEGRIVRRRQSRSEDVINISDFPLIGVHNLENALAAVAAVTSFDIDVSDISRALEGYRPLAHRMERVKTVDGVTYINDSKATNVDAAVKSLRSIGGNVILIMGGLDKEGDFRPLLAHLGRVKEVILIGDAREKIRAVLSGSCDLSEAESLEEAVGKAATLAAAGDTVLLAPACASFDMFANYANRGEVFRDAVNAL